MDQRIGVTSPSGNFENSLRKKSPKTVKVRNEGSQKNLDEAQLGDAVSKLNETENKIASFKSEVEQPTDKSDFKQKKKDFEANSEQLFNYLKEGPISNHPRLHEEVQDAVEVRLLRMAEQIERQKREIEDLKQVVRGKNEYISTLQSDHKKLKGSLTNEQTENQKLHEVIRNKDIEISKLQRENNLDGHVQEVKQNIREDQAKKSPPKHVKETTRDPYDFWKTENDRVASGHVTKKSEPGIKLEDLVGKDNLWVDANLGENISVFPVASADQKPAVVGGNKARTKK